MVITHGVSRAVHESPLHTPQIILISRFDHQPIRNIMNAGAVREPPQMPATKSIRQAGVILGRVGMIVCLGRFTNRPRHTPQIISICRSDHWAYQNITNVGWFVNTAMLRSI